MHSILAKKEGKHTEKEGATTPLMKQYYEVKAKYPGAVVLFRVGDFYETFGEDAIIASKVLGIVLTKRNNGGADVELAGFPHHSLDNYLPRLVRAGHRVAICEQLEDPKLTKKIVKRGVTELVTPGVVHNDKVIEARKSNYLCSWFAQQDKIGLAFLDFSTGEFQTYQGNISQVQKLIHSFSPAEIILPKKQLEDFKKKFGEEFYTYGLDEWIYNGDYGQEKLLQHFRIKTLKGIGIDQWEEAIKASGAALQYLADTQQKNTDHIAQLTRIADEQYVWLDKFTTQNLELITPLHENGTSLLQVLDDCATPMGSRLLRKWLVFPLNDIALIRQRHEIVAYLLQAKDTLRSCSELLNEVGDLERLISKISLFRAGPRDLNALKNALLRIASLKEVLQGTAFEGLQKIAGLLDPCTDLKDHLQKTIKEDAPALVNKGSCINTGVHAELDELRDIAANSKDIILQLQKQEIENTGITSLKVGFNNVFGFYIEVTNTHKHKVPDHYIRKQTLTNGERYYTPELKELEDKVLSAEEKILALEQQLFEEALKECQAYVQRIQQNALLLSQLDVLGSFAKISARYNYCKPQMHEGPELVFKSLRHPVIERQLPPDSPYIPNDLSLDKEQEQIIILTGPNMSGKSALLRQTALAVVMAQAGCFVPAGAAKLSLTDKIFSRVGASDNLSAGESTFMVEMIETASILNNMSERSLVLLDEIGRGTSTYDGVSLAWSIAEALHDTHFRPKTIFATHYHELNELEKKMPRIHNYHIAVKEAEGHIIFLRKLAKGGIESSFGLHVAQMAGIPGAVIRRAEEILHTLESNRSLQKNKENLSKVPVRNYQISMFEADNPDVLKVKEALDKIDLNAISPIEALLKLKEIKELL